eukprot:m.19048 g.19048  ORF g.19048 m.19048 type:complete len:166 (-) comp10887_c0_seq2:104-601(-)
MALRGLIGRTLCQPSWSSFRALSQGPGLPFSLGKVNHVAIAVPDMNKAAAMYKNVLGAHVSSEEPQPEHGVSTIFVNLGGDTQIELIHPLGDTSPIANFLEKNEMGGIHHISIEVSDLKAAITQVKAQNIRTLAPEPKIGAHGVPVMFLHPKDCGGVLVELQQME